MTGADEGRENSGSAESTRPRPSPALRRLGAAALAATVVTAVVSGAWLTSSNGEQENDGRTVEAGVQATSTGAVPAAPTSQPSQPLDAAPVPDGTDEPASEQPSAAPVPSATPVPSAAAGPPAETQPPDEEVRVAVDGFTEAAEALTAASSEKESFAALEQLAAGPALLELQSQADEIKANDWSLEGRAAVDDVKVVEALEAKDGRVRVEACIDSSAVVLTDQDGATIQPVVPPGTRRALNIYDLEKRDDAWIVVDHSFPDDADC